MEAQYLGGCWRNRMRGSGMDCSGSGQGQMAGTCECDDELLGYVNGGNFLVSWGHVRFWIRTLLQRVSWTVSLSVGQSDTVCSMSKIYLNAAIPEQAIRTAQTGRQSAVWCRMRATFVWSSHLCVCWNKITEKQAQSVCTSNTAVWRAHNLTGNRNKLHLCTVVIKCHVRFRCQDWHCYGAAPSAGSWQFAGCRVSDRTSVHSWTSLYTKCHFEGSGGKVELTKCRAGLC